MISSVVFNYSALSEKDTLHQENSNDIKLEPGTTAVVDNNLNSQVPAEFNSSREFSSPITALKEQHPSLDSAAEYQNNRQSMEDESMETSVWADRRSRDVWNNSPQASPQSDRENHMWNEHMNNHREISQEAAD